MAPPSGAAGLIEVELRDRFRIRRVEGGSLVEVVCRNGNLWRHRPDGIGVEVEGGLGRIPCGRESWRGVGKLQVAENGAGGPGIGEEGEDAHGGAALGAAEGEDLIDAGQKLGPAGAGGGAYEGGGGVVVNVGRRLLVRDIGGLYVQPHAFEGYDVGTEPRVGSQDAVVAVSVDARRRDQAREGVQEFERREGEEGAAVRGGTGRLVDYPTDPGVVGPASGVALDPQAVEGEGRPGTVAVPVGLGASGVIARPRRCRRGAMLRPGTTNAAPQRRRRSGGPDGRAPYAGLSRVRFQGTLSIPGGRAGGAGGRGIPLVDGLTVAGGGIRVKSLTAEPATPKLREPVGPSDPEPGAS